MPTLRPDRKRTFLATSTALAIGGILGLLGVLTPVFEPLEQETYGVRLKLADIFDPRPANLARSKVVLVLIDDSTYDWAARDGVRPAFIPRATHAALIRKLSSLGASAIAFDLLFDTPQSGDAQLASEIHRCRRTVLLACGDREGKSLLPLLPEQRLLATGCAIGHTRVNITGQAVTSVPSYVPAGYRSIAALSYLAASLAGEPADTAPGAVFTIRYFYAPGGVFAKVPYQDLFARNGPDSFFARSGFFRDKVVIVGDETRVHGDMHQTPVGLMSGVEIQANAVGTIVTGKYIHQEPPAAAGAVVLLMIAASLLLGLRLTAWRQVGGAILLLLLFCGVCQWALMGFGCELDMVSPTLCLAAVMVVMIVLRSETHESENRRLIALTTRYVSRPIASKILTGAAAKGRTTEQQFGTVLVSDIRGFTALSDRLAPAALASIMSEYFDEMTRVALRFDGAISDMGGDSLYAVFGVIPARTDHARLAISAALAMQNSLAALNERWSPNRISIGIGINTGEVSFGEVGGAARTSYLAYGATVNIAARIEPLNKEFGTRILMTQATHDYALGQVSVGLERSVRLRGISSDVVVMEVLGQSTDESAA